MKIAVNGEFIDMPVQDVSLHSDTFRFAGVVVMSYTTDVELPLTDRNRRLLDVWGVLDRDGQLFGSFIACDVILNGQTLAANMRIMEVHDSVVKVSVFVGGDVTGLMQQPVREIVPDDTDTIVDMTDISIETVSDSADGVHFTQFDDGYPLNEWLHPNIALSTLATKIEAATGLSIEVATNARLVPLKQLVCPQNARMLSSWRIPLNSVATHKMSGQSVCADYNESDSVQRILFSKDCTVAMKAILYAETVVAGGTVRVVKRDGTTSVDTVVASLTGSRTGETYSTETRFTVNVGDYLVILNEGRDALIGDLHIQMTFSDYTIEDGDYNTHLNIDFTKSYTAPSVVDAGWSYVYYGVMTNFGDVTLIGLLNSLFWMGSTVPVWRDRVIHYTRQDASLEIEAVIDKVLPYCDRLGRRTLWTSSEGETLLDVEFANEALADEVTLFQSVFARSRSTVGLSLPIYTHDASYNYSFNELDGLGYAIAESDSFNVYRRLVGDTTINAKGMADLTRVMQIEGRTRADLTDMSYIVILGHKYMLIEWDTDLTTNITSFKALLI